MGGSKAYGQKNLYKPQFSFIMKFTVFLKEQRFCEEHKFYKDGGSKAFSAHKLSLRIFSMKGF
jgi:hypothetical protein